MKQGTMKAELPRSLEGAELTYCYAGGLTWDVGAALSPLGPRAAVYTDMDALVTALTLVLRPQDHVVIMSNGGFGGIHERLLQALARPG
jgi:UDP-N-acetylmuramate: L-alanyl-gamma-D-glutamyl-meso-diaminopimelate ligase